MEYNNHCCSGRKWKPFFIILMPAFLAVFGLVTMLLWNSVLTAVIGVSVITFWQALGILVLSKILFGHFGGAHRWHRRPRFAMANFKEEFMNMNDEEKKRFKEEWRKRFDESDKPES